MGKTAKLRNRHPVKPVSFSSESVEERLSKIENIQAKNSSNVFKYAFFFFMGVSLTIILYPEISSVLAGIRETSGITTQKSTPSEREVPVEQEYSLDDDDDDEDVADNFESLQFSKTPNKTTFHHSERPDKSIKFDTKVEDELINDGTIKQERNGINGDFPTPVSVKVEKLDNIDSIENQLINEDTVAQGNNAKNDGVVRKVPIKFENSDPLEGEIDAEKNLNSQTSEDINPEKQTKFFSSVSQSAGKVGKHREKKSIDKEIKLKPVQNGKNGKNAKQKGNKGSLSESTNMEGRREQKLPKEVLEFKPTILKGVTPKKIFADGRRIPPMELLPQKPNNSSVRVWMFEDFLSEAECDGLMRVHNQHVQDQSKEDPILCFDSVSTLRKHLRNVGKKTLVTPRDFTPGTTCVNASFSRQLKDWFKGNWSYSTAFYPGESRFASVYEHRVKEAMGLLPENGGKFQITSYPTGIGYKSHTDCVEGNEDKRDRVATVLVYLDTVSEGGETMFPELGIWVRPRKARALVWNNMDENGKCEPMSIHKANKVEKGRKVILQRWYYYKSFYSLGKRPPEPPLPSRNPRQPRVSCDEYDHGSCRWYDEWNFEHMVEYERQKYSLV